MWGCFFGEECVSAAEPSSHGRVLYQPVPQPCMDLIKLCTVRLLVDQIVRHHAGSAGRGGEVVGGRGEKTLLSP